MWPILKIDARTQIEAAPDEQTEMRCRSANQSLITDVFALRPYFCTIQLQPIPTAQAVGCQITASRALDGGHQILLLEIKRVADIARDFERTVQAFQFFLTFNWKMRQDFIHSHVAEDPRE